MNRNAMRNGGSERFWALVAGAADDMVSSHGNPRAAPAPRNSVLREIGLNIGVYLRTLPCIRLSRSYLPRGRWTLRRLWPTVRSALALRRRPSPLENRVDANHDSLRYQ